MPSSSSSAGSLRAHGGETDRAAVNGAINRLGRTLNRHASKTSALSKRSPTRQTSEAGPLHTRSPTSAPFA
jgi:ribosome-associated translation inhibitor RaiA